MAKPVLFSTLLSLMILLSSSTVAYAQLAVEDAFNIGDEVTYTGFNYNVHNPGLRMSGDQFSFLRYQGTTSQDTHCTISLFDLATNTTVGGPVDVTTWADVPVPAGAWPFFCIQEKISNSRVAVFFGWSYFTMIAVVEPATGTIVHQSQSFPNYLNGFGDSHFSVLTEDTVLAVGATATETVFQTVNLTDGTVVAGPFSLGGNQLGGNPTALIKMDTDKYFVSFRNSTAIGYNAVISPDGTILSAPVQIPFAQYQPSSPFYKKGTALSTTRVYLMTDNIRGDGYDDNGQEYDRLTFGVIFDDTGVQVGGNFIYTDQGASASYEDGVAFDVITPAGTNNFIVFYDRGDQQANGHHTWALMFDTNYSAIGQPLDLTAATASQTGRDASLEFRRGSGFVWNSTTLMYMENYQTQATPSQRGRTSLTLLGFDATFGQGGPGGPCGCSASSTVTADYNNTLAPDALKTATTEIRLNTSNWNVEFEIHGALHPTNGHIIASKVDGRQSAASALTSYVSAFNAGQLWNPPACGLSDLDVPAASLGVSVERKADCTRSYQLTFSLIDAAKQNSHCVLSQTADDILVACEIKFSTIRAYDLTISNAFLAKETVFAANITLPRTLPNEVGTLLHASLAKCSVYAAPDFYVDCRIPSLWNFNPTFSVTQSPSWIQESTCAQTNGTDATYIRCDLQSISQIYTEATATIAATVLPSGETMHFSVNYSLPREETAVATGSLATFVKSIGTKDGKFYYGNDDLLTLEIEVVDTARLQITQLELFNSDSPSQTYDLRTTPEFATVETQNATFFVITFYPARKLDDSNFYRHGPHGVNVSFVFTAARRQHQTGETGTVTYNNIALKAPRRQEASESKATGSGTSSVAVAAVAASALVVLSVIAVGVIVAARRRKQTAATVQKQASTPSSETQEEAKAATVDIATAEVDHETVEVELTDV